MAYLVAANFRADSLAEYCAGLALTPGEAADTDLTSAIARLSQRFDNWTNDHFESVTLTFDLDADGTGRLLLPQRATAITSVKLRNESGTLGAAETAAIYRLHSSLYNTGSQRLDSTNFDWLEIVPFGAGLSTAGPPSANAYGTYGTYGVYGIYSWPRGPQAVQVVGTFGWTTTPGDVKRAVALLVYYHFKPLRADLRMASSYQNSSESVNLAQTLPSGIPEADQIIADYRREAWLEMA